MVTPRDELLQRVREDATAIAEMADSGNIPLESFIDKTSVQALCDSLQLEPEEWKAEDLEKILIIRDGLYDLRHELRDRNERDAEYSTERFLGAMDRLYADLERAFRELNQEQLRQAQQEIASLSRTPQIEAHLIPGLTNTLAQEASELLSRSHSTFRRIELL